MSNGIIGKEIVLVICEHRESDKSFLNVHFSLSHSLIMCISKNLESSSKSLFFGATANENPKFSENLKVMKMLNIGDLCCHNAIS